MRCAMPFQGGLRAIRGDGGGGGGKDLDLRTSPGIGREEVIDALIESKDESDFRARLERFRHLVVMAVAERIPICGYRRESAERSSSAP